MSTRSSASVTRAPSLEELVLREINAVRTRRGLTGLAASPALSRSAAAHSRAMATYGFFSHESRNGAEFSERIKHFYGPRSGAWTVGENLAMSETAMLTSNPYHAADGERRGGTVGFPLPGVGVRVVDDAGAPCPTGEIGHMRRISDSGQLEPPMMTRSRSGKLPPVCSR